MKIFTGKWWIQFETTNYFFSPFNYLETSCRYWGYGHHHYDSMKFYHFGLWLLNVSWGTL